MMSGYKEYNDVQRCLILIEEKLNWGSSKKWHNDVFIELSERIQEETKVLLSSTTLKRVWGRVNYNSAPSISTLNALAQFAGFLNWRDFKNNTDASEFTFYKKSIIKNLKVIMLSAFIIAALFLSIFSMSSNKSTRVKDYSKVLFKSRAIVEGLPNSVIFDFDLKGIKSDNILIQQYWDATKTIKIDSEQKQATGQYYFPGYFRAKLLIDNQIVKEHDLFIKSNGWLGTLDYEPIPKYFKEKEIRKRNSLSFSEKVLKEVVELEEPITSTFHYVNDLGNISGDNFELVSNVRNLFTEKWGVCQKTTIIIVGTKSALLIPFSISGCASEIGLMLSDVYLDGKKSDLSVFGTDLSSFKNIKIKTEDKNVTVYVEGEQIYKNSYKESLGNIVGLRFKFKGIGEVEDLMLKDLKGKSFLKI